MLNRNEVLKMLDWADGLNPGPWKQHSLHAARAAQTIAEACGMDAQRAWTLGALHDIGRYEGVRGMHHIVAGYNLMHERGEDAIARVCMTHSFPDADPMGYIGQWDVSDAERAFVINYIRGVQMDEYDRLIQLCDALCLPSGVCLMEKRMMDVALRYGVGPQTLPKWRATFAIRDEFEQRMQISIYSLFDEAVPNTFSKEIQ